MTKQGIAVLLVVLAIVIGIIVFLMYKYEIDPAVSVPPVPNPSATVIVNVSPTSPGKCFVGGCSRHICSDQEGVMSTCEYREEYACYNGARCERQVNGACGWTQTGALLSCLNSAR